MKQELPQPQLRALSTPGRVPTNQLCCIPKALASYLSAYGTDNDLLALCCSQPATVCCCCAVLQAVGLATATLEGEEVQLPTVGEGTVLGRKKSYANHEGCKHLVSTSFENLADVHEGEAPGSRCTCTTHCEHSYAAAHRPDC